MRIETLYIVSKHISFVCKFIKIVNNKIVKKTPKNLPNVKKENKKALVVRAPDVTMGPRDRESGA
jgi:hypothetical protein